MLSPTVPERELAVETQPAPPPAFEDVIGVEHASVRYRVPRERIPTIKEYAIRRLQGKIHDEEFWALRDVSLSVHRGEVFGLVGPNGAGKSTLLKLVARVLRPTEGRVWVKGRVAPLLSVGAGFHPELTGRENVFLNGTLLGFTQKEMQDKFDRIVDFAELWDFIDAPLRTYSSGMVARLGFAVATDSTPDVLIVDEILSVGDESFQRKSLARMNAFREQGVTILFVSHSASQVKQICQRAAWLDHGNLRLIGPVDEVVDAYRRSELGEVAQNGSASARPVPAASGGVFADVPADHWARPWIEQLYARGITHGYGGNPPRFGPEEPVTRGELAVMLGRALHGSTFAPEPAAQSVFNDAENHWARPWIEWLAKERFVRGYPDGGFHPDQLVSRAELATFLLRLRHGADYEPPPAHGDLFYDVAAEDWAAAWIEELAHEGIDAGEQGAYRPAAPVTRAELARFLVQVFEL